MTTYTVPAGTYVLGDPCYTMDDEWLGWLDAAGIGGDELVAPIPGTEHTVVAFATAYGDGEWPVVESGRRTGREVCADAGLIGLVPLEWVQQSGQEVRPYQVVVTFTRQTTCKRAEDGTLKFGRYTVRTGGRGW